jgi:hypothetical protein
MTRAISRTFRGLGLAVGLSSLAGAAAAQEVQTKETETTGEGAVSKQQLKGEVVSVGEASMVVKMIPGGDEQVFVIDGQPKTLHELRKGTMLTADVTTTKTPVVERTKTVASGKVFYSSPHTLILTLDNGENKQYDVAPTRKFEVDGQQLTASQLRRGMKLTATKIVEEPKHQITHESVVTGTAPKTAPEDAGASTK